MIFKVRHDFLKNQAKCKRLFSLLSSTILVCTDTSIYHKTMLDSYFNLRITLHSYSTSSQV